MKKFLFFFLCTMLTTSESTAQVTLVPYGTSWKYLDNGSNQGTAWRGTSFNDASWKTGNGKFGYGVNGLTTIIKYGPDPKKKYITTYFRKSINISNPANYLFHTAEIPGDKGLVVYVNGVEVYRDNMPGGTVSYITLATKGKDKDKDDDEEEDDDSNGRKFIISSSAFKSGINVIAVEVHLRKRKDPSMVFDLKLTSIPTPVDLTAPTVQSINRLLPLTQTTNAGSVTFRVTFSEKVVGIDLPDFTATAVTGTVSGTPASVTAFGNSGSVYNVTVNSITGSGRLRLDLKNSSTGITDVAGNAINGGFNDGQTYIINRNVPTPTSVTIASNNTATSLAKAGDVVTLNFIASEPINTPVVTIATHAVTPVAGSDNSFRAAYTMTNSDVSGIIPFTINFSNTLGTAGTQITTTTDGSTVIFDKTNPTVVSINRHSPTTENTTASEVTFRVNFLEPVAGVNATDFVLSGAANGTLTPGAVSSVGTDGTTYDVTVSGITGSGILRLDLKSTGTGITDITGNAISGGFTIGQSYTISQPLVYGFVSVTPLSPVAIGGTDTQHKPQGKTWFYAGSWWCVIPPLSGGTKVYRLDGTTWTEVLSIFSSGGRADCWVVGDLVHILLHRNTLASPVISLQYDPLNDTYIPWSQRSSATPLFFPAGTETGTLTVDGTGTLWVASDAETDVNIWYSEPPYLSWSGPITIASNISTDDICAITKLPGKIGVFWSNQTTGLFGFRTHLDGALPTAWTADEMPASQSAIPGNPFLADDHLSLVAASDGTLYCAIKTSYTNSTLPLLGLMVRRPTTPATWDNLYTVTTVSEDGTQPIVILNEVLGKVKVVYTTETNGGDIVYKESPTTNIFFGSVMPLISGGGPIYNFASSTHQTYNPEIVILATKLTTDKEVVSVLASDAALPPRMAPTSPSLATRETKPISKQQLIDNGKATLKIFPTLVKRGVMVAVQTTSNELMEAIVADSYGRLVHVFRFTGTTFIDTRKMAAGVYYIVLKDKGSVNTQKIMITD